MRTWAGTQVVLPHLLLPLHLLLPPLLLLPARPQLAILLTKLPHVAAHSTGSMVLALQPCHRVLQFSQRHQQCQMEPCRCRVQQGATWGQLQEQRG